MKRLSLLTLIGFVLSACSGSSFSCVGMTPIPGGTFAGPRSSDPLQARISAKGFATLNAQQQKILGIIAPGSTMTVPIPCSQQSTLLGNLLIADQGSAGCLTESCGLMDGVCTAADVPVDVPVTFTNLSLAPSSPNAIAATVEVQFQTGKLFVDSVDRTHPLCLFSGNTPLKCGVDFMTSRTPPLTNTIVATLELNIDPAFSERISVNLKAVDGLKACGTSGALPAPRCTDSADLIITPEVTGCCPGAQFDPVKDLLLGFLAGELKKKLQNAVEDQTCEPCSVVGTCPVEEDGGSPSSCDFTRNICMSTALGRCTARRAGIEGRLDPAVLVSGQPGSAQVDLTLMLGHHATANTGLDLGSRGGAKAVGLAECVPTLAEPTLPAASLVSFDAQSDGGYDLGISVARVYLDKMGHELHQAGGFCGSVETASFSQVSTGILRPFLPSLGAVLGDQDVPMRLLLRPQLAPTFTVRAGTFDPVTNAVLEPLLVANLRDFRIEFYLLLEDRYVRFFTATVDAALPFSLIPDGCGRVLPVIGDLDNVVSNVRFSESEILPDDLNTALGPLLPAVVAFAEPSLTQNLGRFTIPAVGPFKMSLIEAKGANPIGNGAFDHAALLTKLVPADECIPPPPPANFSARILGIDTPKGGQPTVRVQLDRPVEVSYRIDDHVWSAFQKSNGELLVRHPSLMLQGTHHLQLRVRERTDAASTVLPRLPATIDLQDPTVRLIRDSGRISTRGYDSLTPEPELSFAYRFGEGEWFSRRPDALDAALVDELGALTVRVTDGSGRSADATLLPLSVADHADTPEYEAPAQRGCSAVGAGPVLLLALGFIARRRRTTSSRA